MPPRIGETLEYLGDDVYTQTDVTTGLVLLMTDEFAEAIYLEDATLTAFLRYIASHKPELRKVMAAYGAEEPQEQ